MENGAVGQPWSHGQWGKTCDFFCNILPGLVRLHSYGKSPFLMGKSTINGHFP